MTASRQPPRRVRPRILGAACATLVLVGCGTSAPAPTAGSAAAEGDAGRSTPPATATGQADGIPPSGLPASAVASLREVDTDGDGRFDPDDNCAGQANPDQLDADGDGLGDACELGDPGRLALPVVDRSASTLDPGGGLVLSGLGEPGATVVVTSGGRDRVCESVVGPERSFECSGQVRVEPGSRSVVVEVRQRLAGYADSVVLTIRVSSAPRR